MNLLKIKNQNFFLEILGLFGVGLIIAYLSVSSIILLFLTCLVVVVILIFGFKLFEFELNPHLSNQDVNQKKQGEILSDFVSEANFIEQQVNSLIYEQEKYLIEKDSQVKYLDCFINTTLYIRQCLNSDKVLKTTVKKIQEVFDVERVIICRFNNDSSGTILTNFSVDGYQKIDEKQIGDMCFDKRQTQKYRDGYVSAIKDIDQSELAECYVTLLKSLDVKSTLMAPIMQGRILFGLLIAHQCEKPRDWEEWEVNLFKQLAIQVGTALDLAYQYEHAVQSRLDTECLLTQKIQEKNNNAYLYNLDLSNRIKTLIWETINSNTHTSKLNKSIVDIMLVNSKVLQKVYKNVESLSSAISNLQKNKALNQDREDISRVISSLTKNLMQISVLTLNLGLNKKQGENTSNTVIAQEIGKLSAESSQMIQDLPQIIETLEIQKCEIADVEKTILGLLEDAEAIKGIIISLTKLISTSYKTNEILEAQKEALLSVDLLSQEIFQEFQGVQHTNLFLN